MDSSYLWIHSRHFEMVSRHWSWPLAIWRLALEMDYSHLKINTSLGGDTAVLLVSDFTQLLFTQRLCQWRPKSGTKFWPKFCRQSLQPIDKICAKFGPDRSIGSRVRASLASNICLNYLSKLHWPTHFWLREVWWSFSFHFVTLNAGLAFVLSLYVWILRGCQVLILH